MTFEDALASCIDLIEQGLTVDECLARYPAHAADLAPMLTLVAAIRTVQRPRLSPAAFARGRAVVAAQLALESPPPAVVPTTELSASIPAVLAEGRSPTRAGSGRRYTLPQPFSLMHAITTAVAVAVLLLAVYSTVRSVNTSLPGDILYPAKRVTEHVQGSLMVAVGQSAAWHAEQIERRLQESMALQERDGAIAVYLQDDMEERVQFAIDASARMSTTKRQIFLQNWLYNLRQLQTTSAPQGTAELFGDSSVDAALAQTIRTVETAAGLDPIPVIEPSPTVTLTSTPLPPTVTPSPSPTQTPTFTPTSTPTQTMAPLPTATAVMPEVVPPTATMAPTATPAPTDTPVPTDTPAPTNTPQPTATNTRDLSVDPDPDPSTPTSTSPPPTHTPLPPTETPELPVTGTPTAVGSPEGTPEATETLSPDGTPTVEPTSDGSATPQGTGEPTLQPTAEGTPDPDGTPTPTVEPTAEVTAEATAERTSTPPPDGTPQPTAEPTAEVTPEATTETTSTPPPDGTPDPTAEPTAEATAGTTSTPTAPPRPTMDATLEPAATGSASTPTSTATPSVEPTSVLQTN